MNRVMLVLALIVSVAACQQPPADPRITALVERQAINQLVAGDYPRALDAHAWDDYVAMYTEDGELSLLGQSTKGRAAIKTFLGGLPPDNVIHIITNLSYDIQGDTATGGAYWQDIGVADNHPAVVAAGHYEDTLRKVGGEWQFAKRAIVISYQMPPEAPADVSSASP